MQSISAHARKLDLQEPPSECRAHCAAFVARKVARCYCIPSLAGLPFLRRWLTTRSWRKKKAGAQNGDPKHIRKTIRKRFEKGLARSAVRPSDKQARSDPYRGHTSRLKSISRKQNHSVSKRIVRAKLRVRDPEKVFRATGEKGQGFRV